MTNKNIQMKKREGNGWDNLFPLTTTENVYSLEGKSLNDSLDEMDQRLDDSLDEMDQRFTTQLDQIESVQPLYFDGKNRLDDIIAEATIKRKKVKIPAGTYIIDEPMYFDLDVIDLDIEGEGSTEGQPKTRLLWRGGSETMFTFVNTRYVNFKDIEISGYLPGDETRVVVGATAIKSSGVVTMNNVVLLGFERFMLWNGGYYHKFMNCQFRYFKIGFDGFNANNLIFDKCRFFDFERLITVTGGDGPLVFDKCSFERWTETVASGLSGTTSGINVLNSYIENYPNVTPPNGVSGDYTSSTFVSGFGSVFFEGNVFVTNGISTVFYSSSATVKITSKGNRIRYKENNGNLKQYIYKGLNVETVNTEDYAIGGLTQTGDLTPVYIHAVTRLNTETSHIYDPFKKELIDLNNYSWTTLDLSDGHTAKTPTQAPQPSYRKIGKEVTIRGVVDASSSTGVTIATLPSGYRPTNYSYRAIGLDLDSNTGVQLRMSTTGLLTANTTASNLLIDMTFNVEQ